MLSNSGGINAVLEDEETTAASEPESNEGLTDEEAIGVPGTGLKRCEERALDINLSVSFLFSLFNSFIAQDTTCSQLDPSVENFMADMSPQTY